MKKRTLLLCALFFGMILNGFSQTTTPATPKDFFAGKWEFLVIGTPQGDAKFIANLIRKDGKLTGDLADANDTAKDKIAITNLEESDGKIVIYFTVSGYDVNLDLSKVDDNNLKGTLMNMFESKGTRIKE